MSGILSLYLRNDVPEFSYVVELEGASYLLTFKYNERATSWYLDIATREAVVLLYGLPLTTGFPLLFSHRSRAGLPPGEFIVVDLEGKSERPGRTTLGTRFQVLYYSAAEMAALYTEVGVS
jgi:hypothetical protein